jgi:hypothetical protein
MTLKLLRKWFTEDSTLGELYINDKFFCYTLEDKIREEKIKGKTAIPYGVYKVIIDYSNRFKCNMIHILDVPNFEGIRIHAGNTDEDTEGCILVGYTKQDNSIGKSRLASEALKGFVSDALKKGDVKIEITREVV